MVIRRADVRDYKHIARFVRATLEDVAALGGHAVNPDEAVWDEYAEEFIDFIRGDDRLFLVAEDESNIAGTLVGKVTRLHKTLVDKKIFRISVIYVLSEHRRQGVAVSLVKEALGWASDQGCQESDLNVAFGNDKAIGLYQKLGFKVSQCEMKMELPTRG